MEIRMRIFVRKNGGENYEKKNGWFVWSCSEDRKVKVNKENNSINKNR